MIMDPTHDGLLRHLLYNLIGTEKHTEITKGTLGRACSLSIQSQFLAFLLAVALYFLLYADIS